MDENINSGEHTCRTCLARFEVVGERFPINDCPAVKFGENRLEKIKNIMTACSLNIFNDEEDVNSIYICLSCNQEIERTLTFIEQCIRSEEILKQAFNVKHEINSSWYDNDEMKENDLPLKTELLIKSEDDSSVDGDDVPLINYLSKNNNEEQLQHECEECHKKFRSALSLINHKYKHTGSMPYSCPMCRKNFRSLLSIQKHMDTDHDGARFKPYTCRHCTDVFSSRYHLNRHEQSKHNCKLPGKSYSCTKCKRTFTTISSLKFHENVHLGIRPYSCSSCSKKFTSASVLRDHKKNIHGEVKPFQCHCGRTFNRKKKLELHVDSVHEKGDKFRKYQCTSCDKKFHHPYSLKNHLNTHLGLKPYLCNECGSSYTTPSNLRSHFKRVHSGEKKPIQKLHLCHNCGESFSRASHLKRHTLRKHMPNVEKNFECPICKKKFLEKSDVTGHIKSHDDHKPFICSQCSKCFRTAWRLQAHVNRVHLGLRPFECPTCSVKFKTKSHLEKHIRTHTGEKPFPCPHCAYTCAEKSNLKKHINIHLKAR